MKTIILKSVSAVMLIITVHLTAFGGNITSQTRTVDLFTSIKVRNSANVYVTQGNVQSVKIEADEAVINKITTTVTDGKLVIDNDGNLSTNKEIKVTITVKELCAVSIAGSGDVESKTTFTCNDFSADVAGSGNIRMIIDASNLSASIAGSGDIVLNGKTSKSMVHISGSGNIDIHNMSTTSATVSISGSGNCKVNTMDNLEARITGSGNVLYVNEPAHHKEKITGSGEVRKL